MTPLLLSPTVGPLSSTRLTHGADISSPALAAATQGGDFSSVLRNYVVAASDTLKQGESAAVAGLNGSLPVQTVVDQVLAAERTLQAGIAVRDKFVGFYLEVSRMQI
jgi:flagellar hook-basal body complex protein FliE